jgi:hypothetical protein
MSSADFLNGAGVPDDAIVKTGGRQELLITDACADARAVCLDD